MNEQKEVNNELQKEKEVKEIGKPKRQWIKKTNLNKEQKKEILIKVAKGNKLVKDIAKEYNTSSQYISNLKYKNINEFERIIKQLNDSVRVKGVQVADRALTAIDDKKLKKSSAIALANIAKIGSEITNKPQSIVNIEINVPDNREDLLKFVIDGETVDNGITE